MGYRTRLTLAGILMVVLGSCQGARQHEANTARENTSLAQMAKQARQPTLRVGTLETTAHRHVAVYQVGVWQDPSATTQQAFAISLGRVMRQLSADTGHEYCAQPCKQDGTWGAAVLTVRSGRYCPRLVLCPSAQWLPNGQAIHSHGTKPDYRNTRVDQALGLTRARLGTQVELDNEQASQADLALGGWLVTADALWQLDPVTGTRRKVWDYPQPGPTRPSN
jgi:hypothetical protein